MASVKPSFLPLPGVDEVVFAPGEGGLFRARSGERWGYLDLEGRVVVPFAFAEVANGFHEGLAAVNRTLFESTWGYIDREGELVVPHRFAAARDLREGRAAVASTIEGNWRWSYLDGQGKPLSKPRFVGVSDFSGGLAGVRDRRFVASFVGKDLQPAFGFKSSANVGLDAFSFVEGFAAVCDSGHRWGYLDAAGEPVGQLRYDKCWAFSEGRGAVAKTVGVTDDDHEDPLYQVGYLDVSGELVLEPRYGAGYRFKEGFARVDRAHPRQCGRHRLGFINPGGDEVVPCEYQDAADFSEGLAAVCRGEKWGYVNGQGEVVIDFRFDHAGPFSGGLAKVGIYGADLGSYGYIDQRGEEILPREYTSASRVVDGVAVVEQGGTPGCFGDERPGAKLYLVHFAGGQSVEAAAADEVLRDAIERARAAEDDLAAQAAWDALDGALKKLASEEVRRRVLGELGEAVAQPILLENLACEATRGRDDAAAVHLLEKALKQRPDRPSLILGLVSVLLRLGRVEEVGALQARLPAPLAPGGAVDRSQPSQDKLDLMHRLVNDAFSVFAANQKVAPLVESLRQAAAIEQELLEGWQSLSLSGRDIPHGRGELSASGMYIASLRQAGRSAEAALWFRKITADRHLLAQCLRDFQEATENTLNNGIGALIDTRTREDLDYGAGILGFVDEAVEDHASALLPLACCCLATQRGELERALDYLEIAIDKGKGRRLLTDAGSDIRELARADPDLAPLRELPAFDRIVGRPGRARPRNRRR